MALEVLDTAADNLIKLLEMAAVFVSWKFSVLVPKRTKAFAGMITPARIKNCTRPAATGVLALPTHIMLLMARFRSTVDVTVIVLFVRFAEARG